jgi:hypothetical protein
MDDSTNRRSDCAVYQEAITCSSIGELQTTSKFDHGSQKIVSTARLSGTLEVRVTTRSPKMSPQTNG